MINEKKNYLKLFKARRKAEPLILQIIFEVLARKSKTTNLDDNKSDLG